MIRGQTTNTKDRKIEKKNRNKAQKNNFLSGGGGAGGVVERRTRCKRVGMRKKMGWALLYRREEEG